MNDSTDYYQICAPFDYDFRQKQIMKSSENKFSDKEVFNCLLTGLGSIASD